MSNLKQLVIDVTAVDILAPVSMTNTPLLGGAGREAKARLSALPITSVISIEGSDKHELPAEGDASWTEIIELTNASSLEFEIADLPRHVRANVTTLDADGPDITLTLEGVQ